MLYNGEINIKNKSWAHTRTQNILLNNAVKYITVI